MLSSHPLALQHTHHKSKFKLEYIDCHHFRMLLDEKMGLHERILREKNENSSLALTMANSTNKCTLQQCTFAEERA